VTVFGSFARSAIPALVNAQAVIKKLDHSVSAGDLLRKLVAFI
jgi:hypothetical protein